MTSSVLLPPRQHTLLRFSGPDAARYLGGQVTQDVLACTSQAALPACVTDAKGRLQFYVRIFRDSAGAFLVEAPLEVREELMARLSRYLIADDAEAEDLSDEWEMAHSSTPPAESGSGFTVQCSRVTVEGWDLWRPAGFMWPEGDSISQEAAENARIRAGIPAWGKELVPGLLPPEAGLDKIAISYRKGCYIGQEVLSRMKTAGKLNRRLASLLVPPGAAAGDAAGAGTLTSVSTAADQETGLVPALGYIHKKDFDSSTVAITGPDGILLRGEARITGWIPLA